MRRLLVLSKAGGVTVAALWSPRRMEESCAWQPGVAVASDVPRAGQWGTGRSPGLSPRLTAIVVRLKVNINLAGGDSRTLTRGDYVRKPRS